MNNSKAMISRSRINIERINNYEDRPPDEFTMEHVVTEERNTRVISKVPSGSYKKEGEDSMPNFNPFGNDDAILLENNETLNPSGGL